MHIRPGLAARTPRNTPSPRSALPCPSGVMISARLRPPLLTHAGPHRLSCAHHVLPCAHARAQPHAHARRGHLVTARAPNPGVLTRWIPFPPPLLPQWATLPPHVRSGRPRPLHSLLPSPTTPGAALPPHVRQIRPFSPLGFPCFSNPKCIAC